MARLGIGINNTYYGAVLISVLEMGKAADLSEFDKGQIVMARRLDQGISKMARFVKVRLVIRVTTHQKWFEEEKNHKLPLGCGPAIARR